jgi:hypothetical protein
MALLERDDELAALRARARGGALVLVLGEAGAGKTALVHEFAAGAAVVRWGACEALSTPRPLGPFLDLGLPGLDDDAGARDVLSAVRRLEGVVVLEDLHWADEATLDVVRGLGASAPRLRAPVIATLRDDELARTTRCASCSATSRPRPVCCACRSRRSRAPPSQRSAAAPRCTRRPAATRSS